MEISFLLYSSLLFHLWTVNLTGDEKYFLVNGQMAFKSEAPLELIQAETKQLQGVLDLEKNTFAFAVNMNSFLGFNSKLQKEHFCERFMDCERFPKSNFSGKIIELIDYSQPGRHEVRAKGNLMIHGIERERIIRGMLEIGPGGVGIDAEFSVRLEDHDIDIPKVVNQNISEEIHVKLHVELFP